MKLVNQRGLIDCGIAVVAMLSNLSYRRAQLLDPNPYSPKGLEMKEILGMLETASGEPWSEVNIERGYEMSQHVPPRTNAALLLRHRWETREGHWICWDARRKKVLDPALKDEYRWSEYLNQDMILARVFVRAN